MPSSSNNSAASTVYNLWQLLLWFFRAALALVPLASLSVEEAPQLWNPLKF